MEDLLAKVREKYGGIVSKLGAMIMSEELASEEEDAALLRTTEEFLTRMLPVVSLIQDG